MLAISERPGTIKGNGQNVIVGSVEWKITIKINHCGAASAAIAVKGWVGRPLSLEIGVPVLSFGVIQKGDCKNN